MISSRTNATVRTKAVSSWLGTLMFLLCIVSTVIAQSNTGRILGTVKDSSGKARAAAKITVTNSERGASRALESDASGNYVAPNLPPGTYSVQVNAEGFRKASRSSIVIQVGEDVRVDFDLISGQGEDAIAVSLDVPQVNSTNTIIGGTLTNKAINDLPLNGRDFQNLVVLRPGMVRYPGGGVGSVSSNGLRPEMNSFLLDGVIITDPYYSQPLIDGTGVQGTPSSLLPIDSIQEFNVQSNQPSEYGRRPGNLVNIGLKSGTNATHGTAYYFGRNSALDARNYFNTDPDRKNPLRLHQFGGTAGGAIVRNKLFYFAGYEGIRDLVSLAQLTDSPVTVGNVGDTATNANLAAASVLAHGLPVSPLSQQLLTLLPANNGSVAGNPTTITTGFPNRNRGDNGLMKLDYRANDYHYLAGTYFIGDSTQTEQDQPVLRPEWESTSTNRSQVVAVNWIWTPGPFWVNEARIGYTRMSQTFLSVDTDGNPEHYCINTGFPSSFNGSLDCAMPKIWIQGFASAVSGTWGGNAGWPQRLNPTDTFQIADNVTWIHDQHVVKFGGDIIRNYVDHTKARISRGKVSFTGGNAWADSTPLEDFLAGYPTSGQIQVGDTHRQVSYWSLGAFVEDTWRVSPRVTLEAGLRYELNTVIKEAHNQLGNFDPSLGLVQVGNQIDGPYSADRNNFAPRLGMIWDVTGSGKTIVRAGGSVFYQAPPLVNFLGQFNFANNSGTIGLNIVPTGGVGVTPGNGTITAGVQKVGGGAVNWTTGAPLFNVSTIDCSVRACDVFAVDPKLRSPYVSTWNVNVQQALTRDMSVSLAYIGNHGSKQYGVLDINQLDPVTNTRPYSSKFSYLGFINQMQNAYRSNYNGLQATLTRRPSRGLSFVLGYTYSHARDMASDSRAPQAMNSLNPEAEYGNSDFDIRHRLTVAMTYDLPAIRSPWRLLEGLQLNSIITLQSGQPWNVMDSGNDISGTHEGADRWDFTGDPSDFSASHTGPIQFVSNGTTNQRCVASAASLTTLAAYGCYVSGNSVMTPAAPGTFGTMGRNIFRGPGLYNLDLSISKKFTVTERVSGQFRAEFFNVLNHPNFANPYGANNTFSHVDPSMPSTFGYASATPDVAAGNPVIGTGGPRNIQLGLKFTF